MTKFWMSHPDIELPALTTEEAFVDLYEAKGFVRVDLDLAVASQLLDVTVTGPEDLTPAEVATYVEHRKHSDAARAAAETRRTSGTARKSPSPDTSKED